MLSHRLVHASGSYSSCHDQNHGLICGCIGLHVRVCEREPDWERLTESHYCIYVSTVFIWETILLPSIPIQVFPVCVRNCALQLAAIKSLTSQLAVESIVSHTAALIV